MAGVLRASIEAYNSRGFFGARSPVPRFGAGVGRAIWQGAHDVRKMLRISKGKSGRRFRHGAWEAEYMLKRAASESGDKARDLRAQVETKLLRAKLRLQELQEEAVDRTKEAARATDDYIHDNPWQVIGVAAAVGVVIGVLMSRRS